MELLEMEIEVVTGHSVIDAVPADTLGRGYVKLFSSEAAPPALFPPANFFIIEN